MPLHSLRQKLPSDLLQALKGFRQDKVTKEQVARVQELLADIEIFPNQCMESMSTAVQRLLEWEWAVLSHLAVVEAVEAKQLGLKELQANKDIFNQKQPAGPPAAVPHPKCQQPEAGPLFNTLLTKAEDVCRKKLLSRRLEMEDEHSTNQNRPADSPAAFPYTKRQRPAAGSSSATLSTNAEDACRKALLTRRMEMEDEHSAGAEDFAQRKRRRLHLQQKHEAPKCSEEEKIASIWMSWHKDHFASELLENVALVR